MQRFRLQAPMKATLLNVLESYPGGQLVSEALQNAEDSGASQFTLVLDLRSHGFADAATSGPAFVLVDDGAGFGPREWKSLQNLHSSEKRSTPQDIGRYGMGSRSYFHYADVTMVVSRGRYVGVDPLEVVSSHGRDGGWQLDLSNPGQDNAATAAEATRLAALPAEVAGGFDPHARGALFRLPLRREEDVQREDATELGSLGPEISVACAEAHLSEWAASAPRLLLFLSSVRRLAIWRWAEGAAAPVRVASVSKEYLAGSAFARLPPSLPAEAVQSYGALRRHLLELADAERSAVSAPSLATVRITTLKGDAAGDADAAAGSGATTWLVAQSFDAATPALLDAVRDGCEGVPVVGVAVPVGTMPVGGALAGSPFCFLPIGGQSTGLPVHINGAFALLSNRRDLWLPTPDLDGAHARMARWNDCLLRHSVPRLWVEVLRRLGPSPLRSILQLASADGALDAGDRVLAALPDIERVAAAWRPCAERLYELLRSEAVLPHSATPRWVPPSEACALVAPSDALASQTARTIGLYAQCPPSEMLEEVRALVPTSAARYLVALPAHVRAGCWSLSGLQESRLDHAVKGVLSAARRAKLALPVDVLRPVLLALMAHAGTAYSAAEHEAWRSLLSGVAWVTTLGGEVVELAAAFAPLPRLERFRTSRRNRAELEAASDVVVRAAIAWGLKPELSWADCVAEAEAVAEAGAEAGMQLASRVEWAQALLRYIAEREEHITNVGPPAGLSPKVHKAQLGRIAFHPAREPCRALADDWDGSVPHGALCLRAAETLHEEGDARFVWAVRPSAVSAAPFLSYGTLSAACLVEQMVQLAQAGASEGSGGTGSAAHVGRVGHHLLEAARRLAQHCNVSCSVSIGLGGGPGGQSSELLFAPLRDAAWVPAAAGGVLGSDALQLLPPRRVAYVLREELWPRFGRLPDGWASPSLAAVMSAAGVERRLSCHVLAAELQSMASQHGVLDDAQLELAVRLANELAKNLPFTAERPDPIYVPTASSGRLLPSSGVFLNDAPWHSRAEGEPLELLHDTISAKDGRSLGCSSIREELARVCEQPPEELAVGGVAFGQSEPLHRRIEGLLLKYNDEKDVFVEHYQNCDDAGASDVLFLLDDGSYAAEQIVSPAAAALQGPSLLLASSRALTDDDLSRIQQLGGSHKRGQFSSAGRFGLGLNSFYHLSDNPQIFAKGLALVVLDPLHALSDTDGRRYAPAMLERHFPSMLAPFAEVGAHFPTIFRLPLRTKASDFGRTFSAHSTRSLLERFMGQAEELLLFTKHVKRIGFGVRSEQGGLRQLAEVKRTDTQPSSFMQQLPTSLEETVALRHAPREGLERVSITVTRAAAVGGGAAAEDDGTTSEWLVAHSLAVDDNGVRLLREAYSSSARPLALLPHGAVALRLDAAGYAGNVAAVTPIGMPLGAPLVVHGCFALDDSRKVIALPDSKLRIKTLAPDWNQSLLDGPCARSYLAIVLRCCDRVSAGEMALDELFRLLELSDGQSNGASGPLRESVRRALWKRLLTGGHRVFPVASPREAKVAEWLPNGPATRLRLPHAKLGESVQDRLMADGLQLVYLPESLRGAAVAAAEAIGAPPPASLAPSDVCRFLPAARRRVSPEAPHALQSPADMIRLLRFVLPAASKGSDGQIPSLSLDFLRGVPLLLLSDGSVAEFGTPRFWNESAALLPHAPHLFIHEECSIELRKASPSMKSVKAACAELWIRNLEPADLLEHCDTIHAERRHESAAWQAAFWAFALSDARPALGSDFRDWRVLKVELPNNLVSFEPLSKVAEVFDLYRVDADWQDDLRRLLIACGVSILHEDHAFEPDQAELLHKLGVRSGDDDLISVLADAMERTPFKAAMCEGVLRYYASRKQNSPHALSTLRRMPLFLRATPDDSNCLSFSGSASAAVGERFVHLRASNMRYLVLGDDPSLKHKHAANLMRLKLQACTFLAPPTEDRVWNLYQGLGVEREYSLKFVTTTVPRKLQFVVEAGGIEASKLLTELTSWVCDEAEHASKEVINAVKRCHFIPCVRGGKCSATELLDPGLEVAKAFRSILSDQLPTAQFAADHSKLLKKLGWLSYLPPTLIERCARHVDAAVAAGAEPPGEELVRQSFWLVESIAAHLSHVLGPTRPENRRYPSQHVTAAVNMRVLLTTRAARTPEETIGRVMQLASGQPVDRLHGLALRTFHSAVGPACGPLAWAIRPVSAHDELGQKLLPAKPGEALPATKLHELTTRHPYPKKVCEHLRLRCNPAQLELDTMFSHLEQLADGINRSPLHGQFDAGSALHRELTGLLAALNLRVSEPESRREPLPPRIASLSAQPCLPFELGTGGGAGAESAGTTAVKLVAPCKLFWELGSGAEVREQSILHDAKKATYLLLYKRLCTALGVRESPSIADWADCTRDVFLSQRDDESGTQVLPCDIAAIKAAVTGIAGAPSSSSSADASSADASRAEVFLIALDEEDDASICSSGRLLYADQPRLKSRCGALLAELGLKFVHAELVRAGLAEHLVRHTTLRRMSDVVREAIAQGTVAIDSADVNSFDRDLEALLRSDELSAAYVALCYGGSVYEHKTREVHELLSGLQLRWAAELTSVLVRVEGSTQVEGSEVAASAILDGDALWLRAGSLGGEDEHGFLLAVAQQLTFHLRGAFPAELAPQKSELSDVLKCWSGGAAAVERRLQELNVRDATERQLVQEPGELVPTNLRAYFDNSLHCAFSENELVAVERDDDAGFQSTYMQGMCVFAKFRRVEASPPSDGAAGENQLTRKYLLWCGDLQDDGGERLTAHSHLCVFKITRKHTRPSYQHPPPPSAAVGAAMPQLASAPADEARLAEARREEFDALASQLAGVSTVSQLERRRALRRLYLTWHPDHCRKPHAATFFRTVHTFANLLENGQEGDVEAFLHTLTPEAAAQGMGALGAAYDEGPQPHTWFDEFAQEAAAQQQGASRHSAVPAAGAGSSSSSDARRSAAAGYQSPRAAQAPRRLTDPPLADVAWVTAQEALAIARLLHDSGHAASSIFHSHQAAEQLLKAVMLRTCGVTGDEFHGAAGHDLVALVQRLPSGSPASEGALRRLSQAYLGTRYSTFPPRGPPTLPSAAYSAQDAHEALQTASSLLEWARETAQVESTSQAQALRGPSDADGGPPRSARPDGEDVASEAARRVQAEGRARTAELEVARLTEEMAKLRAEATQAVETAQRTADAERARALEEARAAHEAEMGAATGAAQVELAATREGAERLQRALHALTGAGQLPIVAPSVQHTPPPLLLEGGGGSSSGSGGGGEAQTQAPLEVEDLAADQAQAEYHY